MIAYDSNAYASEVRNIGSFSGGNLIIQNKLETGRSYTGLRLTGDIVVSTVTTVKKNDDEETTITNVGATSTKQLSFSMIEKIEIKADDYIYNCSGYELFQWLTNRGFIDTKKVYANDIALQSLTIPFFDAFAEKALRAATYVNTGVGSLVPLFTIKLTFKKQFKDITGTAYNIMSGTVNMISYTVENIKNNNRGMMQLNTYYKPLTLIGKNQIDDIPAQNLLTSIIVMPPENSTISNIHYNNMQVRLNGHVISYVDNKDRNYQLWQSDYRFPISVNPTTHNYANDDSYANKGMDPLYSLYWCYYDKSIDGSGIDFQAKRIGLPLDGSNQFGVDLDVAKYEIGGKGDVVIMTTSYREIYDPTGGGLS